MELSTKHSDASPGERARIWNQHIREDAARTERDRRSTGSRHGVPTPSPFRGNLATEEPHCKWAAWRSRERGLPARYKEFLPELSRGELMTRGIGCKDKDSHTGRMSDAPAISCCRLLDGDEFILITTPSINDAMPAQKAISIGGRALQAAGHAQASKAAEQKESCFEAAGRSVTKAMAIAPEGASAMAAHVILVRSKEAEVTDCQIRSPIHRTPQP